MKAVLVSVRSRDQSDAEALQSLEELRRLVSTLGMRVIATETQRQNSLSKATVVGSGKLEELFKLCHPEDKSEKPDVVIFDCDLSPSQLKNVEKALDIEIMDRSGIIIEIFSRHARSRESRVQVEIARLKYLSPRIREMADRHERQAGRGAGESQLELDRRKIRDQLTELRRELTSIQREQDLRRKGRKENSRTAALVGYTNAGKSSWMRALSGSEVLVEDKLFATLDTTVRALSPETHPRILISDTVGFIHKLPHDLVASFHSTLEEAAHAALLLVVVDASDPVFLKELAVVNEALSALSIDPGVQKQIVFNKIDRISESERQMIAKDFSDALFLSVMNKDDVEKLKQWIVQYFERGMIEEELFVPFQEGALLGEVRNTMRVVKESFEENGVHLIVRTYPEDLARFKSHRLKGKET